MPVAVISIEFVAELKLGDRDEIVATGAANVKLQLFPGQSASDDAAKITSTRLF